MPAARVVGAAFKLRFKAVVPADAVSARKVRALERAELRPKIARKPLSSIRKNATPPPQLSYTDACSNPLNAEQKKEI